MSGRIVIGALTGALFAAAGLSCAQSYPTKPIRVIVPTVSGGGGEIVANTPEEFTAYLRAELARWKKVAKEANIHVE